MVSMAIQSHEIKNKEGSKGRERCSLDVLCGTKEWFERHCIGRQCYRWLLKRVRLFHAAQAYLRQWMRLRSKALLWTSAEDPAPDVLNLATIASGRRRREHTRCTTY
jgi:hypothetical protein